MKLDTEGLETLAVELEIDGCEEMDENELFLVIADKLNLIPDNLDELKVEELKGLAKALGVIGYSNMNKQELIDVIGAELNTETP